MRGPLAQLNALQAQPNLYFKEYMRTGGFLQFPWRWSVYANSECLPMAHKAAQNPAHCQRDEALRYLVEVDGTYSRYSSGDPRDCQVQHENAE